MNPPDIVSDVFVGRKLWGLVGWVDDFAFFSNYYVFTEHTNMPTLKYNISNLVVRFDSSL